MCYKWGKAATAVCLLTVMLLFAGCRGDDRPRMRFGAFFGSPTPMKFPDPNNLGKQDHKSARGEVTGMLYTRRGGFIDLGHVREAADRTKYTAEITRQNLMRKKTEFSFRLIEPSRYWVTITYPKNWDYLSGADRKRIANEVSISLGQYFAHTSLIWHEIITWYGFSTVGIFSDQISSFSPEDSYSDLLGTYLGASALRQKKIDYDEAVTKLIYQALKQLDVQPAATAHRAEKKIEGDWYTGGMYFWVVMKKRNFDVGFDNGYITPWLVDGICPNATPQLEPVMNLGILSQYGFGMKLEIEPRIFEKHKICRDIGLDTNSRINPAIHFPKIMKQIEKEFQEGKK